MDLEINNSVYKYKFFGKQLKSPQKEDFCITNDDILACKDYHLRQKLYNKKCNDLQFKIEIAPAVLLYIAEVLLVFLFILKHPDIIPEKNSWFVYIFLFACPFLFCYPFVIWQSAIISLCLWFIKPEEICDSIAKKIIKDKPTKPNMFEQVQMYKNACSNFEDGKMNLWQKHAGIDSVNYDIVLFGSKCIIELVGKIIKFTDHNNGIIYKDNLRQEQKFWYELDPYDFELEVAHWFEQQGYHTHVISKTGDGGIDIIVSKPNYIAYVQCKRYRTSKVDRPTLNALYGNVCADKVNQGIVVCLLGVTEEAKEFASKVGIKIITVDDLAPENSLFFQKKRKQSLQSSPIQDNQYWCKIGKLILNTNCYSTQEDLRPVIEKWEHKEMYHILEYKGLFYCIHGQETDMNDFRVWLNKELCMKRIPIKKSYRRKGYYRSHYWR